METSASFEVRSAPSPYSTTHKAIERRALQSEAMGLCLGVAGKLSLWSERLGKKVSAEPSTKEGIEAVRLLRLRCYVDVKS